MGTEKTDKTVWVQAVMLFFLFFSSGPAIFTSFLIPFGSTLTNNFHHKSKKEIKFNLPHDASRVHATGLPSQR